MSGALEAGGFCGELTFCSISPFMSLLSLVNRPLAIEDGFLITFHVELAPLLRVLRADETTSLTKVRRGCEWHYRRRAEVCVGDKMQWQCRSVSEGTTLHGVKSMRAPAQGVPRMCKELRI